MALLILQFLLLRAGLMWRTYEPGAASAAQLRTAFIIGARFDLATAGFIALPVMLACFIPFTSPQRGPRRRWWFLWTISIIVGLLSFLLLCEFEFFREFQSRFNQLAIRYLNQPATVGGMVWYNYPVLRYVAAGVGVAALFHLGLRLVMRWAFPVVAPSDFATVTPTAPQNDLPRWRGWSTTFGTGLALLACVVIAMRGGLQHEPLRWGDAFHGDSEFANQMSLNGIYCLASTLRDMTMRSRSHELIGDTNGHSATEQLSQARQIVRSMILAPTERLLDPQNRTMYRVGDPGSRLRLRTASGRPVNVVTVLMESFSARYVGACGAAHSYTPRFDEIAHDGTLFDRALSAGTHTHQGIFASQLGFPNLPHYESLMESTAGNQEFMSAAEIFRQRGYHTLFLYNGKFDWDNMYGFFHKQGMETFIGRPEMEADAKYVDKVWGVSDGDEFDRANKEFEAASKKGPFYATILTLSNHAPFQVPSEPGLNPVTDQGEMNGRLTAMQYADWAVGHFIEDAKKLDYFRDTLFVFVGDHGFHVPPVLTELHLLYHHIPMVYYAPGLLVTSDKPGDGLAGVVDHRVATHTNIIPSILGLLGITDSPQSSWARSLFNDHFPDPNFAVIKNTGGSSAVGLLRDNKLMILFSAGGKPILLDYQLGQEPDVTPLKDSAMESQMEIELRAFVQAGLDDLLGHRAGPPKGTAATLN